MPAVDLPENVAGALLKHGSEFHQQLMSDISGNISHVHNLTRSAAFRAFQELDTLESRANSGVLATPIASPATQSGGA